MMFADWKERVNRQIMALAGLEADDLPDCPYYEWYDMAFSPREAAREAIRHAKEY